MVLRVFRKYSKSIPNYMFGTHLGFLKYTFRIPNLYYKYSKFIPEVYFWNEFGTKKSSILWFRRYSKSIPKVFQIIFFGILYVHFWNSKRIPIWNSGSIPFFSFRYSKSIPKWWLFQKCTEHQNLVFQKYSIFWTIPNLYRRATRDRL